MIAALVLCGIILFYTHSVSMSPKLLSLMIIYYILTPAFIRYPKFTPYSMDYFVGHKPYKSIDFKFTFSVSYYIYYSDECGLNNFFIPWNVDLCIVKYKC